MLFKRKKKAKKQEEPVVQTDEEFRKMMDFHVAGVSFHPEVIKEIKADLIDEFGRESLWDDRTTKKEVEEYDLIVSEFQGLTFDVDFEEYTFEGERAFRVLYMDEELGSVPKGSLPDFIRFFDSFEFYEASAELVGGKTMYFDYDEEKVLTDELDDGVEVFVVFS